MKPGFPVMLGVFVLSFLLVLIPAAGKTKGIQKGLHGSLDRVDPRQGLPFVLRHLPCNDIIFVKTMKCASSTFSEILSHAKRRCQQEGHDFHYKEGEMSLYKVESKARSVRVRKHYFRFGMCREPLSRVISQFYQCRPSKYHAGGANQECAKLAKQGPAAFFRSERGYASNLMSNFLSFRQDVPSAAIAANLFDFIVVKERLRESLAMLHFYGVLSVRDILFTSAKNRTIEHVPMSKEDLDIARAANQRDFMLYDAVLQRHNATVALFNGLDLAARRWEEKLQDVQARCSKLATESSNSQTRQARREMKSLCLDKECEKWEPCRQNDLALGLPGVGLATDLRGDPSYLRLS